LSACALGCNFGLDGLRQQHSRAVAQHLRRRIGKSSWLEIRKTLVSVTAYHSFGGEVEVSNTPTIRRLTPSAPITYSLRTLAMPLAYNVEVAFNRHESQTKRECNEYGSEENERATLRKLQSSHQYCRDRHVSDEKMIGGATEEILCIVSRLSVPDRQQTEDHVDPEIRCDSGVQRITPGA
jgi:hypothetical protein